jgi:hypothetical protein
MPPPTSRPSTTTSPDHPPQTLIDGVATTLPEFVPRYLAAVDAAGDELGEPTLLMELADFVSELLAAAGSCVEVMDRALGVVEDALASRYGDDPDFDDMVAFAFFDSLSPDQRHRLGRWLGPHSTALVEWLDGEPEE